MKSKMYAAVIASLGAVALLGPAGETFAASGASSHHSSSHRSAAHFFRHHRRTQAAVVFGDDGSFFGPTGQAVFDGPQGVPGGVASSNTNDIPWDWAHRYPPIVAPSQRPYVSSCAAETVTVPDGRGGNGQVNIMRCY